MQNVSPFRRTPAFALTLALALLMSLGMARQASASIIYSTSLVFSGANPGTTIAMGGRELLNGEASITYTDTSNSFETPPPTTTNLGDLVTNVSPMSGSGKFYADFILTITQGLNTGTLSGYIDDNLKKPLTAGTLKAKMANGLAIVFTKQTVTINGVTYTVNLPAVGANPILGLVPPSTNKGSPNASPGTTSIEGYVSGVPATAPSVAWTGLSLMGLVFVAWLRRPHLLLRPTNA